MNPYSKESAFMREVKNHMVHEIIPELSPSVTGNFQVRVIGIVRNAVEIELRIVDPETKQVLKSFGSKVITPGRTITLEGLESKINFLPKDFEL